MNRETRIASRLVFAGASEDYKIALRKVRDSIAKLKWLVGEHERDQKSKPDDYGYVGDLGSVNETINNAIRFLGSSL